MAYHWLEDSLTGWALNRDQQLDGPSGWIQWKGTDVCMDVHCACGVSGHFDGAFFYYYKCMACGRKYAVGQRVRLIELTEEVLQRYVKDVRNVEFHIDDELLEGSSD